MSQATHDPLIDPLTGVGSNQKLETEAARWSERGPFSVLYTDVVRIRLLMDVYGYRLGDALLVALARLLERHAENGQVFRVGGDGFMVLLRCELDEAVQIAERIAAEASRTPFASDGSKRDGFGVNIVVAHVPTHGETWKDMRWKPGGAMIHLKLETKGRVRVV